MIDNGNSPAQPFDHKPEYQYQDAGLTKLEHFAGLAMQGLLANSKVIEFGDMHIAKHIAEAAIEQATALLKELDK